MFRFALSLAVVLAAGLTVSAQTYTLKVLDFPPEGKSIKATEKMNMSMAAKATDQDGKEILNQKNEMTGLNVYTEKTVSVEGKKQKKYERKYEKSTMTLDKKTVESPYHGRTITYDLVEGKYKLGAEGKPELTEKDLAQLSQEANKDSAGKAQEALFPRQAVKVGETWKLDAKAVAKYLGDLTPDPEKTKGEGKLVKVYKKDGKQYGVMEFTITFDAKTAKKEVTGSGKVNLTLDVPIDGTSAAGKLTAKMTMTGTETVTQDGKTIKVVRDLSLDGTLERADAK